MKRISTFTYVYCGVIMAAAVALCMGFFHEETITTIKRTTEIVNNGIFMTEEILEATSAGRLVKSDAEGSITKTENVTADETANQTADTINGALKRDREDDSIQQQAEMVQPVLPVEEYKALCKIVQAEAGNQDARGKQLIANVVLNRVANDHFPDTVREVIHQDNGGITQFAPTKNGSFRSAEISIDTMAAVNRALAGEDVSGGALYFKAGSETSWGGLTFLFQHGNHVFFM